MTEFTGFYNRYYRSPTGKESQQWLLEYLKKVSHAESAPSLLPRSAAPSATLAAPADPACVDHAQTAARIDSKAKVTFDEFTHSWGQSSVIVRLEASKAGKAAAPVVLSQSKLLPRTC